MSDRTYLFIGGCSRSGTSALARQLNWHPKIVCGEERYKGILRRTRFAEFTPSLFEEERFFDFRPDDTDHTPDKSQYSGLYRKAKLRFASAEVVGDKVPAYAYDIRELNRRFSDARFILIFRDVLGVANSYKRNWAGRDPRDAIMMWNRVLEATLLAMESVASNIFIVRYEALYSGSYDFTPMLAHLGLEDDPAFARGYAVTSEKSVEFAKRAPLLDAEEVRDITAAARYDLYDKVVKFAR
ncbi:MAG TPA: sulfotransferase [Rhizomicrobium sp.]|jgi:hypothetical protein|nr:sulfotransferase [Rhizomicrobium sp.]